MGARVAAKPAPTGGVRDAASAATKGIQLPPPATPPRSHPPSGEVLRARPTHGAVLLHPPRRGTPELEVLHEPGSRRWRPTGPPVEVLRGPRPGARERVIVPGERREERIVAPRARSERARPGTGSPRVSPGMKGVVPTEIGGHPTDGSDPGHPRAGHGTLGHALPGRANVDPLGHPIPGSGDKGHPIPESGDKGHPIPGSGDKGHPIPESGDKGHPIPEAGDRGHPLVGAGPLGHPIPGSGAGLPLYFDDRVPGQLVGANHAAVSAAAEAAREAGTLIPVGLNAPRTYAYEAQGFDTDYAPLDALLADLDATGTLTYSDGTTTTSATVEGLGIAYIRQPTHADTIWPAREAMPVYSSAVSRLPAALGGDRRDAIPDTLTRDNVYWLLYDELWDGLHALFSRLGSADDGLHPIQVVLTWLTLGANNPDISEPGSPTEYKPGKVLGMSWDAAHGPVDGQEQPTAGWDTDGTGTAIEQVYIEDTTYSPQGIRYDISDVTSSAYAFVMASLDPRSRYKLVYCYYIGRATAQILLDLQSSFNYEGRGIDLFRHLRAIELGNELNHADAFFTTVADASDNSGLYNTQEAHALLWARAVREGVRGLQEVFAAGYRLPDASGSAYTEVPVRVPLWLPSLAGYYKLERDSSGYEPTFAGVQDWQLAFLVQLEAVSATSDGRPEGSPSSVDLSWFTSQDYHFYHYVEVQCPGHIARLAAELEAIRTNVAGAGLAYLSGITYSVSEGGASTDTGEDSDHTGIPDNLGYQSYLDHDALRNLQTNYPYLASVASLGTAELAAMAPVFQAREVWRRLCAALYLGGPAGWHTHRDTYGSPYVATGVRDDSGDDGTTDHPASTGFTRPSWWALQRLGRILGLPSAAGSDGLLRFGGVPPTVAMTLPSSPGSDYYQSDLDPTLASDMVVVYTFEPGTVADYVYVILTDPTADDGVTFAVSVDNPDGARVWQVPSVPTSITPGAAFADQYFPVDTPSGDWNQVVDSWPESVRWFTLTTTADADPIVLLSTMPLTITVA